MVTHPNDADPSAKPNTTPSRKPSEKSSLADTPEHAGTRSKLPDGQSPITAEALAAGDEWWRRYQARKATTPAVKPTGEPQPRRRAHLIDAKACGAMLSVPASWVLAQARRDAIPYVKLGRYVRFDPVEVEAWWRERTRGPNR